jgi:hypothetical protein
MELDICTYSVRQLKLRRLWGFFTQKDSEIVLSKGLDDPENNSYGCWSMDLTATPTDRSPTKRTPWAAIGPQAPPYHWHLNLTRVWDHPVVSWSHSEKSALYEVWHSLVHSVLSASVSKGHMETGTAVQYDYTPSEHARMLSLDSRKNISRMIQQN